MTYNVETSDPITTAAGTFRVCVQYDSDMPNPREDFDQLGTWVSWDRRQYLLPREGNLAGKIEDANERGGPSLAVRYLSVVHRAVALPVYGDERTSAGKLGERIDGGARITGVIYALRADIEAAHVPYGLSMPSDAEIAKWLAAEVDQYATWANGEMTGYVIERACCPTGECGCDSWHEVDASWGYFSVDEAMEQGRASVPTDAAEAMPVEPSCEHERSARRVIAATVCGCGALFYQGREYRQVGDAPQYCSKCDCLAARKGDEWTHADGSPLCPVIGGRAAVTSFRRREVTSDAR